MLSASSPSVVGELVGCRRAGLAPALVCLEYENFYSICQGAIVWWQVLTAWRSKRMSAPNAPKSAMTYGKA